MATANCQVLHSFIKPDGKWAMRDERVDLDLSDARAFESKGYVDVLTVNGNPEVWSPCCDGCHKG